MNDSGERSGRTAAAAAAAARRMASSNNGLLGPGRTSGHAPPLHLTVRFLSLPDIALDVARPGETTVAVLKTCVRAALRRVEEEAAASSSSSSGTSNNNAVLRGAANRRLRILYGGRLLGDDAMLASVLRPLSPSPPPRNAHATTTTTTTTTAPAPAPADAAAAAARLYVSCSLGDLLTKGALATEAEMAVDALAAGETLLPPLQPDEQEQASAVVADLFRRCGVTDAQGRPIEAAGLVGVEGAVRRMQKRGAGPDKSRAKTGALLSRGPATATSPSAPTLTSSTPSPPPPPPPPRGFDRLLAAGFTAAEVNQLRLQFRSIQAARYTPDTMPSADALRGLEDRWLDSGGWEGGGGGGGGRGGGGGAATAMPVADGAGAGGGAGEEDLGMPGLLDVMVRGMLIGFLWPLAGAGWLSREPGLWSRRWQVFVSFGVVLSVVMGTIKTLTGE